MNFFRKILGYATGLMTLDDFDEMVLEAKAKGDNFPIDIKMGRHPPRNHFIYEYSYPILQARKRRVKLYPNRDYSPVVGRYESPTNLEQREIILRQQECLEEIVSLALKYNRWDFDVTCNGKLFNEMIGKIREGLDKRSEKLGD